MRKIILITLTVAAAIVAGLLLYRVQSQEKATPDVADVNSRETSKKDVREAVWNQLDSQQRQQINGTWKDGQVSQVTLPQGSTIVVNKEITKLAAGRAVYIIDFPTKNTGVPNNMIVYADLHTYNLIGFGLLD